MMETCKICKTKQKNRLLRQNGPHIEQICNRCGSHIKFVEKDKATDYKSKQCNKEKLF